MIPSRVTWGRFQLEFGEERVRLRFAGSPRSDALLFGLLGLGIWCIICIPCLVLKADISPWIYVFTAVPGLVVIGVGAAIGKKAEETGFVAARNPSPCISLMQGGEAIVLPAEDIRRFVTRVQDRSVTGQTVTWASLVAETRRGEFVVIPEMLTNRKGADTFGRLLTALLLEHGPFEDAVRRMLDVRRRDLILFGVVFGGFFALLIAAAIFLYRSF